MIHNHQGTVAPKDEDGNKPLAKPQKTVTLQTHTSLDSPTQEQSGKTILEKLATVRHLIENGMFL